MIADEEDSIVQLYFTDRSALRRSAIIDGTVFSLSAEEIAAAEEEGLVDGIPFILGAGGSYDHRLNAFFRACPTMGVRSLNSLRAYGRDISVWMRFLIERRHGKAIWGADRNDIVAFHRARRLSEPPFRISAGSWNRCVAVLEKFYGWAVLEGHVAVSPLGSADTSRVVQGKLWRSTRSSARERAARAHNMLYLDLDRYLAFRDVGLRGRLPDGTEDPSWRGRNGDRNALFAELLVTTGMRVTEAGSILVVELPGQHEGMPRSIQFDLPGSITKGNRPRRIRLPRRVLALIHGYVEFDRRVAAAKSIPAPDPMWTLSMNRRSATGVDGHHVALDRLTPIERRSLLDRASDSPEHALLWLTETGRPMPVATWEIAFTRASERCRRFGIDIAVTPHMLRHTFAVNMLSMLIRTQIGAVFQPSDRHGAAYRHILGDPLRTLQHLLGHASITSTYIYLDSLAEAQELVEAAAERWSDAVTGSAA
ncbi:tyrosine-type recombinase/integrase [Tardiphaga sp.]|uniref:tyrosine-type recombinase/integrase n=1 Tax=Tardiphaga sp. TaxID=1926292 RepID=UPI00352BAAC2